MKNIIKHLFLRQKRKNNKYNKPYFYNSHTLEKKGKNICQNLKNKIKKMDKNFSQFLKKMKWKIKI